jgi:beta-glucosidase
MWQARAWRSTGVSIELGPQVDVYSNPIGTRTSGSVCEDPAINRDFTKAFGGGMQSTWGDDEATKDLGWGKDSVAVMLKHFVGEGSNEGGRDDHSDMGKWDVFPGSNFEAHLIPFLDGGMNLDSATGEMASIMPNYGVAYSEDEEYGPLVGGGFNAKQLSILRNAGWDGMICSDWNIIGPTQRGLDDLTEQERLKVMFEAGVVQYGGQFYPDTHGKPAFDMIAEERGQEETAKHRHSP